MSVKFYTAQRFIQTEVEYELVQAELDRLLDRPIPKSMQTKSAQRQEGRIAYLTMLIEEYEKKHHPEAESVIAERDVLRELQHQRANHRRQWGGEEHDDTHVPTDWAVYRANQEQKIAEIIQPNRLLTSWGARNLRRRLLKIASLCIDEIVSMDRQCAPKCKLCYDTGSRVVYDDTFTEDVEVQCECVDLDYDTGE